MGCEKLKLQWIFKDVVYECVDCIHLTQDMIPLLTLLKTLMDHRSLLNVVSLLTSWATVIFSRTVIRGVLYSKYVVYK